MMNAPHRFEARHKNRLGIERFRRRTSRMNGCWIFFLSHKYWKSATSSDSPRGYRLPLPSLYIWARNHVSSGSPPGGSTSSKKNYPHLELPSPKFSTIRWLYPRAADGVTVPSKHGKTLLPKNNEPFPNKQKTTIKKHSKISIQIFAWETLTIHIRIWTLRYRPNLPRSNWEWMLEAVIYRGSTKRNLPSQRYIYCTTAPVPAPASALIIVPKFVPETLNTTPLIVNAQTMIYSVQAYL